MSLGRVPSSSIWLTASSPEAQIDPEVNETKIRTEVTLVQVRAVIVQEKVQTETESDTEYYDDSENIWKQKFAIGQDASKQINMTVIADPD